MINNFYWLKVIIAKNWDLDINELKFEPNEKSQSSIANKLSEVDSFNKT